MNRFELTYQRLMADPAAQAAKEAWEARLPAEERGGKKLEGVR